RRETEKCLPNCARKIFGAPPFSISHMSYGVWKMAFGIVIKRSRPMTYVRGGAQYLRQILLRAGDGLRHVAAPRQQGRHCRRERTAGPARLARLDLRRSKNVEIASVKKDVSSFVFH